MQKISLYFFPPQLLQPQKQIFSIVLKKRNGKVLILFGTWQSYASKADNGFYYS